MNYLSHMKNLTLTMKPYAGEMIWTIISAFLKQASLIGISALSAYTVGLAVDGTLGDNFKSLLIALSVCILVRALMYFLEMHFAHDVAFRVIRDFRLNLYSKISELSPAYVLGTSTGQIAQTLVNDVEILELFMAHTFAGFIVAVIITVAILIVLANISPIVSVMLLITAIILVGVPYFMKNRAGKQGQDVRENLSDTNAVMVEGVQGLRELITLNYTDAYQEKCLSQTEQLYSSQHEYGKRKGVETLLTNSASGIFTVTVMIVAASLVVNGEMDFVMYPVAIMLSSSVLSPVIELAAVSGELGLVFAASTRIQNILADKPLVEDKGKKIFDKETMENSIEFRNVSFSYTETGSDLALETGTREETTVETSNLALKDVCFTISPGETVVLVGHSGAGKTTCANLLLRYWDPKGGQVLIGGTDIREYSLHSLRASVSAVQQETYLFHTSIADNIRLGKPDATMAEIESAAKVANAHEFICGLPDGYDTIAGERGFSLSGGQRQRIAIARALLADTPIVIFDEAVSALDTENERDIQRSLKTLLAGKTVLTIAHRLSTILSADRVVLLEHGAVVASGTHTELLTNCPKYRELIENQLFAEE